MKIIYRREDLGKAFSINNLNLALDSIVEYFSYQGLEINRNDIIFQSEYEIDYCQNYDGNYEISGVSVNHFVYYEEYVKE